MIKLESSKMQKAIARAKQMKPRVRMIGERIYRVSGSRGNSYTVTFSVANGLKLGACTCPAGEADQMCYHIAAAAAVNIAIQTMRKAAAQKAASAPAAVATDDRAQLIADIKAAWHRARPFEAIALKLHRCFGVSKLEDVSTDDLRRVMAALTPVPAAQQPRHASIPYTEALDACARGKNALTGFYGPPVRPAAARQVQHQSKGTL